MESSKHDPPGFDLRITSQDNKEPNPTAEALAESLGLVLICPRCTMLLTRVDHELGIAWRCSRCGGQSLNFSQFRRMIPEAHANEIWFNSMENPKVPKRRTPCPECRIGMRAVLIHHEDKNFELDICPRCQRLWLDLRESNHARQNPGLAGPREIDRFII
jgi:Zn-finger nucleic acid-binding protein